MSATALARASSGPNLGARRRPNVVLVGAPTIARRRDERDASPLIVIAGGNWQDETARLAAMCNPGGMLACGCPPKPGCNCGMVDAANKYQPNANGNPCDRMRWVPLTFKNPAIIAANSDWSIVYMPQAPLKLAQMKLATATATDLTNIVIAVGDTQSVLPGPVDGTYFDIADTGEGAGRFDAPIATPGQSIVISGHTVNGYAARALALNVAGAWGGR